MEQRIVPLPPWVGIVDDPIHRVRAALHLLDDLKLLAPRKGPSPDNPNLCVSPVGKEILDAGRVPFFERALGYTGLASFDPARDFLGFATRDSIRSVCWRMGHEPSEFEGLGRRLSQRVLEVFPPTGSTRMIDMETAFAPTDPHDFVRGRSWTDRRTLAGLRRKAGEMGILL